MRRLPVMSGRRVLLVVASLSLGGAAALLSTPIVKSDGLWAVTVGSEMSGFVPVGTGSTTLAAGAFSNRQMLGPADSRRLAAAVGLAGLSAGCWLALAIDRSR